MRALLDCAALALCLCAAQLCAAGVVALLLWLSGGGAHRERSRG
jgi:hypothetical protein